MKTIVSLSLIVGLAIALAGCGAKTPAAAMETGTLEITGKVSAAASKNRRGQDITVASITVREAKTADGKPLENLKGKAVLTNRRDGEELLKYEGKEVVVTGAFDPSSNNVFRVETIKETSTGT